MKNSLFNNLVWIGCGYAQNPTNVVNDSAKVYLFDANPTITSQLTKLYSNDVKVDVYNEVISSKSGTVEFLFNKCSEFSSINKPNTNLEDIYSEANIERIESVKSLDICQALKPLELNPHENNLLILDILDQNSSLIDKLNESKMLDLFDWVCIRTSSIQLYDTSTSSLTGLQSISNFPKEYEFLTRIEGDKDFGYYMFRRKSSFSFVKEISEYLTSLKQELSSLQKSTISKDSLIEKFQSHNHEVQKLKSKNENLESLIVGLDNEFSSQKDNISKTLENYKTEINKANKEIVSLLSIINNETTQRESITNALMAEIVASKTSSDNIISSISKNFDEKRDVLDKNIATLRSSIEKTLLDQKSEKEAIKKEIKELEVRNSTKINEKVDSLDKNIATLRSSLDKILLEQKSEKEAVKKEIKEFEVRNSTKINEKVNSLDKNIATLRSSLDKILLEQKSEKEAVKKEIKEFEVRNSTKINEKVNSLRLSIENEPLEYIRHAEQQGILVDDIVKPVQKSNVVLKNGKKRSLNFVRGSTSDLIRSNQGFKFALDQTVHFFKSDAIATFIPKSACSSLRLTAAMQNLNIDLEKDYNWIHLNNRTFNASLSDIVTATYTFVILRCPYSRLLSAYLDKFLSRSLELWQAIDREGRKFEPEDYTFERYVDHVCKFPNSDQHWKPQTSFLIYEQYDDYYCIEDTDFMIKNLKKHAGFDFVDSRNLYKHGVEKIVFEDPRANIPSHKMAPLELLTMKNKGALPSKKSFFSEPILEKVKKVYSKDIELYKKLFGSDNLMF
jgi:hypothetical protein